MKLLRDCDTQDECRQVLEELRWPLGVECPTCQSRKISRIRRRFQYECYSCRYKFSVTAGTIFHDSHLPLPKWFAAVHLMCESKNGVSAVQLRRTLHIPYQTAWYLCHRIRTAMREVAPKPVSRTFEVDDAPVDKKNRRRYRRSTKPVVFCIRQRKGNLRLIRATDAKAATAREIIKANPGSHIEAILTDKPSTYRAALRKFHTEEYKTPKHIRKSANCGFDTNALTTAFSLLTRGLVEAGYRVDAKYVSAYLDEVCFRFNNRGNPHRFRDTLARMLQSPNLELKNLTA